MGKGSQKNQQKSNPDRQQAALEELEKLKAELMKFEALPNKSPEDKDHIEKLKARSKHLKKKAKGKSEQHSQREKGSGRR